MAGSVYQPVTLYVGLALFALVTTGVFWTGRALSGLPSPVCTAQLYIYIRVVDTGPVWFEVAVGARDDSLHVGARSRLPSVVC